MHSRPQQHPQISICCSMLCYIVRLCTTTYDCVLHGTIVYYNVRLCTTRYDIVLYCTMLYDVVLYRTVLYSLVLWCALLYYAALVVRWCTILYDIGTCPGMIWHLPRRGKGANALPIGWMVLQRTRSHYNVSACATMRQFVLKRTSLCCDVHFCTQAYQFVLQRTCLCSLDIRMVSAWIKAHY